MNEQTFHRARSDLTLYSKLNYPGYRHAAHLDALDYVLTQVSLFVETEGREGLGRVIIEMPPRHGKSIKCSRIFPTWHLGRNPDHRIMMVSYGASLAEKNSRGARGLIQSPFYQAIFPGVMLAPDSRSSDSWDLHGHKGGVDALGIQGGATGKGAHVLIIDDPVKSRAEAESQTYRDGIWDAFKDDLYTRLEPGGAVILIMTRWHTDDLVGRVLKYLPGEFKRLRLPAIAHAGDPIKRKEGEALWEARYPLSALLDREATLGPYSWAALYDQNPIPSQGGLFKLPSFEPLLQQAPPVTHAVRFWDLAMSEKTTADYTAGVLYGMDTDSHRYVLDVFHQRLDWGDVTKELAKVFLADGPGVIQGIEKKGYMSRAVQDLNADERLHGYSIFGYPKDTDKVTNALSVAAKVAAGYVHVLDRHWTQDFLDEVCSFPSAAHDDMVDALAGAEHMLGETGAIMAGSLNNAAEDPTPIY